jgi:hypothetical protein
MVASGIDPVAEGGSCAMLDIDDAVFFAFTGANGDRAGGFVKILDFDRDDLASSDAGSVEDGDHCGVSASAWSCIRDAAFDESSELQFRESAASGEDFGFDGFDIFGSVAVFSGDESESPGFLKDAAESAECFIDSSRCVLF